jgi:hypothetical protein
MRHLNSDRLAADYSREVRRHLTAGALINIRNGVNVVADYDDENQMMYDAVAAQLGDDFSWAEVLPQIAAAFAKSHDHDYRLKHILVACEESGILRESLAKYGHSVWSCDTDETSLPGNHLICDVREIMNDGWHQMVSFPPCTYLAGSQVFRMSPKHNPDWKARRALRELALEFVTDLFTANVDENALENSVGIIPTRLGGNDYWDNRQCIQPYQFGHDVSKKTVLFVRNLPLLPIPDKSTWISPRVIEYQGKTVNRWANQSPCGADSRGPSAGRGRDRSKTYSGIASMMSKIWGAANT